MFVPYLKEKMLHCYKKKQKFFQKDYSDSLLKFRICKKIKLTETKSNVTIRQVF